MESPHEDLSFVGYRRRIELTPFESGIQTALEDDFHRFTLKLVFDGDRISAVDGTTERTPWSSCPAALPYLIEAVRGRTFDEVQAMARVKDHCTHLLDLAVLATAHAGDQDRARFDMTVTDPVGERRAARLYRDGNLLLDWTMEGDVITGPGVLAGRDLRKLGMWVDELSAELREPAALLRRVCFISRGRQSETQTPFDVAAHRRKRDGACYTYTGERLQDTSRKTDWRIDFSSRPEQLLARDHRSPRA